MGDRQEQQLTLWEYIAPRYMIHNKVLLIELFSGMGAQAKAFEVLSKYLGVKFEYHKTCEWAYNSIIAYNALHTKDFTDYSKDLSKEQLISYLDGNISTNYNEPCDVKGKPIEWLRTCYNNCIATHNLMNISKVKGRDLDFTDNTNQTILMSYSFPCQDISLAGLSKGYDKESGTRSGLLWEVERIIGERERERLPLPNILVMENVEQVVSQKHIKNFKLWEKRLRDFGYSNFVETLDSSKYGIPQKRRRTFMISILGDYSYDFPHKFELKWFLEDMKQKNVPQEYFIKQKTILDIEQWNSFEKPLESNSVERERESNTNSHNTNKSTHRFNDYHCNQNKWGGFIDWKKVVKSNDDYIEYRRKGALESECRLWKGKESPTLITTHTPKIIVKKSK